MSAGGRPLRFGYAFEGTGRDDLVAAVYAAEQFGYDTFVVPDHLDGQLSPIPALAAVATLNDTLRVAPWVLCNDFHIPQVVARELATIDVLSRGRLDVAIGAGWRRSEFLSAGIAFDSGGERLRRLKDAVAVMKATMAGGPVTLRNDHFELEGHLGYPPPLQKPRPPLMLGGGGRRLLEWAATEADIVSIIPLTTPEGTVLASELTIGSLERKIGWIRDAAGARFDYLVLNVVLVDMTVTGDRRAAARSVSDSLRSGRLSRVFVVDADLSEDDILASPYFAFGTTADIAEHIERVCVRTGVSYYTPFPHLADTFGPVVEQLTR